MDSERALDHAWRYFHLHAQQRITVFNFYIVFTGLLVTGIAAASHDFSQNAFLTAFLGGFLAGLSFLFYKLDQRVSFLIKNAEKVIESHEPLGASIFSDEINQTIAAVGGQWSYGRVFRTMFAVMSAVGVIVVIISVCAIFDDETGGEDIDEVALSKAAESYSMTDWMN